MNSKSLIVKVRKNSSGNITGVMLNTGEIYPIDDAVSMSKKGLIEDIVVKKNNGKFEYFRNNSTNHGDDSFNNLPQF